MNPVREVKNNIYRYLKLRAKEISEKERGVCQEMESFKIVKNIYSDNPEDIVGEMTLDKSFHDCFGVIGEAGLPLDVKLGFKIKKNGDTFQIVKAVIMLAGKGDEE